jgi:hypothetical protein
MNLGIPPTLSTAFPGIIPVSRPLPVNLNIPDPN